MIACLSQEISSCELCVVFAKRWAYQLPQISATGDIPMKILTGIVVALLALWCGGWFAASWWANGRIGEVIEIQRQRGVEIDCADRAMSGFPFNMGVGCNSVTIRQADGSQIDAGAVRTAASLTAPGEANVEIDSPLTFHAGDNVFEANWKKLGAFVDATFDGGFDLTSFAFDGLTATNGEITAGVKTGTGLLRPQASEDVQNPGNLEAAVSLGGVTADIPGVTKLPPFSIQLDAMLEDGYRDIVEQQLSAVEVLNDGAKGEIRKAKLELSDGGKLVLGGPFELDENGILSGSVTVGLANPEAVMAWARSVSPALEQPVSLLTQSVAGMGVQTTLGGEQVRAIELTIDKGEVRLGFIKLLDLPPLK